MMYRQKELKILTVGIIGLIIVFIVATFFRNRFAQNAETIDSTESVLITEPLVSESEPPEEITEVLKVDLNIQDHYITNTGDPSNLYYIDEKGTLWGCGRNDYGQLGQGTQDLDFREEMVRIAEHVVHVDYSQNGFTIFLTEDHKLYGMGTAATGVLREMNEITYEMFINRDQYVVTNPKLLLENVIYARCGNGDVACIMEDGSVWNWGTIWQEGMSSYCLIEPQKVLEEAVLVTGGWYNHAALLKDGSVWTWGYNYAGNCGVAGEIVISNPVKVAEDVIMVWTGNTHYNLGCYDISEFDGVYERYLENTIILKADGTYWACGIGLGGKTKILDRYWEASYYEVECTNEFVQVDYSQAGRHVF